MRRINAWLVAGAVVGTGLLTDMAAQAFAGRTVKLHPASTESGAALTARARRASDARRGLTPPAHAPRAHHHVQVVEPVAGGTPTPPPATPAHAASSAPATPAPAASAPAATPATPAPAPAAPAPVVVSAPVPPPPPPAPVVSGGS